MSERIKLEALTRIQDIFMLDDTGPIEKILLDLYSPDDDQLVNLSRLNKIDPTVIVSLEEQLKGVENKIGRLYINIILWLYYKAKGREYLVNSLHILSAYYKDINVERDSTDELFSYRILNNLFYYLPILLRQDEIESFKEFTEFITTYEHAAEILMNEILVDKPLIENASAPFWFIKPLFSFYCSNRLTGMDKKEFKRLLELLLERYIAINDVHWASSVIAEIEKSCFKKEEYIHLKKKVGDCYFNAGSRLSGLKAIHYLRVAAMIYKQIDERDNLDHALRLMKDKEKTIEWQHPEITTNPQLLAKMQEQINNIKAELSNLSQGKSCLDLLKNLFNNHNLPDKTSIEKQSQNLPISYLISTTTPMTEGRSGVLENKEEYIENWKAHLLVDIFFRYYFSKIVSILDWFVATYGKDNFKECLMENYRQSLLYEEERGAIIKDIMDKYFAEDFIGFVYSLIPQIEHVLKILLIRMGTNIRERNLKKLEEINLNTILVNYKEQMVTVCGDNFYGILWLCFIYEYGLNIRNSVSHGEGLTYLRWEYATLLFFIINFLFLRGRALLAFFKEQGDAKE